MNPSRGRCARPLRRGAASAMPASGVTAAPSRIRATSVAKYQPPASTWAGGPSARTSPSPSSTTRSANRAANSTSCVATTTAEPLAATSPSQSRSACLRAASIPRVGSSRQTRPGISPSPRPAIASASASRWRSPPERSRGSASPAPASPTRPSAASPGLAGQLVGNPVADDHLRGTLRRERDAARRRDRARGRRHDAGGGPHQRRLAGAVAPHQDDPFAAADVQGEPAQGPLRLGARVELDPQAASRQRAERPRPARQARCGTGVPRLIRPIRKGPPGGLDSHRERPDPDAREQASRPEWRGRDRRPRVDSRNAPGSPSKRSRPSANATTRSAAAGIARAGARRSGRSPPTPRSAVAGARSAHRPPPGRAARWARRAGSTVVVRPGPRPARRAAARRLRGRPSAARGAARCPGRARPPPRRAPAPRPARRGSPAAARARRGRLPRPPASRAPGRPSRPSARARPVRARGRSSSQIRAAPATSPPWKCGIRPARRTQEGRLARARAAGEHHHLPRFDPQVDLPQGRTRGVRVAVREAARARSRGADQT